MRERIRAIRRVETGMRMCGNPLTHTDPSGQFAEMPFGLYNGRTTFTRKCTVHAFPFFENVEPSPSVRRMLAMAGLEAPNRSSWHDRPSALEEMREARLDAISLAK